MKHHYVQFKQFQFVNYMLFGQDR